MPNEQSNPNESMDSYSEEKKENSFDSNDDSSLLTLSLTLENDRSNSLSISNGIYNFDCESQNPDGYSDNIIKNNQVNNIKKQEEDKYSEAYCQLQREIEIENTRLKNTLFGLGRKKALLIHLYLLDAINQCELLNSNKEKFNYLCELIRDEKYGLYHAINKLRITKPDNGKSITALNIDLAVQRLKVMVNAPFPCLGLVLVEQLSHPNRLVYLKGVTTLLKIVSQMGGEKQHEFVRIFAKTIKIDKKLSSDLWCDKLKIYLDEKRIDRDWATLLRNFFVATDRNFGNFFHSSVVRVSEKNPSLSNLAMLMTVSSTIAQAFPLSSRGDSEEWGEYDGEYLRCYQTPDGNVHPLKIHLQQFSENETVDLSLRYDLTHHTLGSNKSCSLLARAPRANGLGTVYFGNMSVVETIDKDIAAAHRTIADAWSGLLLTLPKSITPAYLEEINRVVELKEEHFRNMLDAWSKKIQLCYKSDELLRLLYGTRTGYGQASVGTLPEFKGQLISDIKKHQDLLKTRLVALKLKYLEQQWVAVKWPKSDKIKESLKTFIYDHPDYIKDVIKQGSTLLPLHPYFIDEIKLLNPEPALTWGKIQDLCDRYDAKKGWRRRSHWALIGKGDSSIIIALKSYLKQAYLLAGVDQVKTVFLPGNLDEKAVRQTVLSQEIPDDKLTHMVALCLRYLHDHQKNNLSQRLCMEFIQSVLPNSTMHFLKNIAVGTPSLYQQFANLEHADLQRVVRDKYMERFKRRIVVLDESISVPKPIDKGIIYIQNFRSQSAQVNVYWSEGKAILKKSLFSDAFFEKLTLAGQSSTDSGLYEEMTVLINRTLLPPRSLHPKGRPSMSDSDRRFSSALDQDSQGSPRFSSDASPSSSVSVSPATGLRDLLTPKHEEPNVLPVTPLHLPVPRITAPSCRQSEPQRSATSPLIAGRLRTSTSFADVNTLSFLNQDRINVTRVGGS